jgi:hypothetical protein
MGKAIRASVVVLLLACSAYAGEIQNDVKQPTSPPASAIQQTNAGGIMPNDFTETVLSVLGSLLALL